MNHVQHLSAMTITLTISVFIQPRADGRGAKHKDREDSVPALQSWLSRQTYDANTFLKKTDLSTFLVV